MFQDNPLLAQLKEQLHAKTPRIEGIVKGTDKGFGFLETDGQKSYFIPPSLMKKVMHGDRITAVLRTEKEREIAEPEQLIEPFLQRFVGRIQKKDDRLSVIPDHPLLKESIPCRPTSQIKQDLQQGDWVVAEMQRHPLKGDRNFYAELTEFITLADDHFAPWWVTLARHNLDRHAPEIALNDIIDENIEREDLTALSFITIDGASTEDMDDALFIETMSDGAFKLTIAIADPTAYIAVGSSLDIIASQRLFTHYLPGFDIPMLPRQLSDDRCSLRPNEKRPALVCRAIIAADGSLSEQITFSAAWIESKAKLVYNDVSDWLEKSGSWQPENEQIASQLMSLQDFCHARTNWRQQNALVFKDRPEYHFILNDQGDVLDIATTTRRIANRIVEEAMIVANICAAKMLASAPGFGIYNVHQGFEATGAAQASALLANHDIEIPSNDLLTLAGFRQLRQQLDQQPTGYLDSRIRRFQSFADISTEPGPHFGLGLEAYATWTSPIRKFGDMINHRLLKNIIQKQDRTLPAKEIVQKMAERRRQHRMAERDVSDWLYARFLLKASATEQKFDAEIIDVSRGGLRVRLTENGAVAFVPSSFLHSVRDELLCHQETGTVKIKGEIVWRVADTLSVTLSDVRMETRSIIARPLAS